VLAALLIAGWSGTWLGVRFGRHQPTAIDGTWLVVSGAQPDATLSWQQVFFERNQAHTVVFRSGNGDTTHHFSVGADGIVRIWERLRTKGPLIMQGRVLPGGRLQLDEVGDHAAHILLKLQRPPHA